MSLRTANVGSSTPVLFSGPSQFLALHARRRASTTAIVDAGVDRTLTYAELDVRVNQLCHRLLGLGIEPGQRISVLATDSHQYLETVLACTRTGITLVPLNVRLADPEIEVFLDRAAARVLFVGDRYVATGRSMQARLHAPATIVAYGADFEAFIADAATTDPGLAVDPEATIGLAFTSGTTGLPKAVQQPLRMIANIANGGVIDYELGPDELRYSAAPMFHVAGMAFPLMHIARGITSLILPQFDAPTVLGWLQGGRLTGAFLVPTMISTLLETPGARDSAYENLRTIVYGAAPITPALLRRAISVFGCDFIQSFGAGTEAGGQSCLSSADHRRALAGAEHLLSSVGRPSFGVDLRIVDDDMNDVPVGTVGEIATRSSQVMTGYLDQPEVTAEVFRGGWFRAGDLGRLDADGYLYLAGRSKDMIIRGGENIYPIEVESVLMEHPALIEVAVVGQPDEHWGEIVHAHVVRRDESATDESLRELCRGRLASHKIPAVFHFVDELPRNAAGKILKRVLRSEGSS